MLCAATVSDWTEALGGRGVEALRSGLMEEIVFDIDCCRFESR